MGYPDSFIIDENKNQAYKQFGNGVVIDVLQHILNEIEVVL
jgi:DNA (cytosine-5)-methyltransferase 1